MTDESKTGRNPAGAGRGANLKKAKKEKNDEFYTRMEDVENELRVLTAPTKTA